MTCSRYGQPEGRGLTVVRAGLCVAQAGAPEPSCLPGVRELEGTLVQPPPNTGSFCPAQALMALLACCPPPCTALGLAQECVPTFQVGSDLEDLNAWDLPEPSGSVFVTSPAGKIPLFEGTPEDL